MKVPDELDIPFSVNNIIGFPGETRELAFDTIELNRHFNSDSISCSVFVPFHGTELRDVAEKQGLVDKEFIFTTSNSSDEGVLDMPQWRKSEVAKLRKTFTMYVKFPKSRWPEIEKAETDPVLFNKLSNEYIDTFWSKKDEDLKDAVKGLF